MKGLTGILFFWLAGVSLSAQPVADNSPGSGAPPGSVSPPTGGLPLATQTRALAEQLQFDIEQLHTLLSLASGVPENPPEINPYYPGVPPHPKPNAGQLLAGNFSQNFGVNYSRNLSTLNSVTPPGVTPLLPPHLNTNGPFLPPEVSNPAPPRAPNTPLGTNELVLLGNLESGLQGVQAEIQELLRRLDRLAPAGGATLNGSGGTGKIQPGASGFTTPPSSQFATTSSNQVATPLNNGARQLR